MGAGAPLTLKKLKMFLHYFKNQKVLIKLINMENRSVVYATSMRYTQVVLSREENCLLISLLDGLESPFSVTLDISGAMIYKNRIEFNIGPKRVILEVQTFKGYRQC